MKKTESQSWDDWFLARRIRLRPESHEVWRLDNDDAGGSDRESGKNTIAGVVFRPTDRMPISNIADMLEPSASQTPPRHTPVGDEDFLVWAPKGLPAGQRVCLLSSRIGRHPEKYPWWLDAIRTSIAIATEEKQAVVFADGMATTPFLSRIAQLFGLDRIEVRAAPLDAGADWFGSQSNTNCRSDHFPVWLISKDHDLAKTPLDPYVAAISDLVRAMYIAPNGNIEKLIRERLISGQSGARTWILIGDSETPKALVSEFVELGAIRWLLEHEDSNLPNPLLATTEVEPAASSATRFLEKLPADLDEFLAHWTRAPSRSLDAGSDHARIDCLLFGLENEMDGALTALLSIVVSGRLAGGSRLTRDSTPVVSFTEASLSEFRQRRVFRSHLGRWDFELYGVAIRRSRLKALGVRPVVYGSDDDWKTLAADERPWFQYAGDANGIDWTVEREWRFCGDLDLKQFGSADLYVFAPDVETAAKVSRFSRWPVIVVP